MTRENMLHEKGFSLIESLLVTVIVGSIAFLLASLPNALSLISKSQHLSLAREIAVKQIEDNRAVNFSNLVNDSYPVSDSRISLLPGGAGMVVIADCDLQICASGEHIKTVSVTINWTDIAKPQTAFFQTLIGEGGLNQ